MSAVRRVSGGERALVLDAVREVALGVAGSDEEAARRVSMARWTTARRAASAAGLAGPTSAAGVCKALGVGWPRVLELAFAPEATRGVVAGQWAGRVGDALPDELLVRALRAVALRLGRSPYPEEHDVELARLDAERQARVGETLDLPCATTIATRYGSWAAALAAAGLDALVPRRAPGPAPISELVDACIDELGVLPTLLLFDAWARQRQVAVGRDLRPWSDALAATRTLRLAAGKPWPAAAPRGYQLPAPPADAARGDRGVRSYTLEDVLASLRRYAAALGPGEQPRQKHYLAVYRARPDLALLAPSVLGRRGRFQELYATAIRQQPAAAAPAPTDTPAGEPAEGAAA